MFKLLLSLTLAGSFALPAISAENTSFDQLLNQLTSVEQAIPVAPVADSAATDRQADGRYWVTVKAADKHARTRLLEAGFDIVEIEKGSVSGFAGPGLLGLLSSKSFGVVSKMPIADYAARAKDFPSQDSIYHNYQETYDLLKEMASKNADIASLFSLGKTVEGRDIWCLRINSSAKGETPSAKPGAVYMGNHHAREHLSNEVPLLFAAWLFDHKGDADIKKYISTLDIYVIPMINPDGVEYDIKTGSYQYYRKNMAKNAGGSRGVDLNRNYDSWFCEAGASDYPGSDTYCGPKAFSEPESQAVQRFALARKNLKTLISYHSYGGSVLYPWGGKDEEVPNAQDARAMKAVAEQIAKQAGYFSQKSSEMYIATGDTCDWLYEAGGIFAFTIELEGRGFYPGAAIVKTAVEKNVKAGVYMLSVTDNPYKVI